ncbi:Eco57I restriction-modification methylase domain-containing protein [Mesorhizobium salmacidum]|uniref:site-specific DNA-methyltransferase (adenine-specific) n=1 Tax=Mesorhizobium salmacidum TaxID=3015171 RepID=A0ABU8KTV6_9HYPH
MVSSAHQGSLFSNDFVQRSIVGSGDWTAISADELTTTRQRLADIFARFPTHQTPNETQTEHDLIWRVLSDLGWNEHLQQQNLTERGRQDVPDGILYLDRAAKDRAVAHREEWRRYEFGAAIVESKRWGRPLDRRSEQRNEIMAPSTQMLRYLRRVDDLTNGSLRWGILTNGARWRLYFSGARSVSEQFFEIDLAAVLGVQGFNEGLFALTADEQQHWLKVFLLMFRREAFVPGPDHRTFHQRAMDEGRFYEERVAQNLSDLVFGSVFPALAQGIAQAAPDADLEQVRDAALILLYRLLFILYAEDRDLLPVRDRRYDDYGLRERVRLDVGRRKDAGDVFSATAARYWSAIADLCLAIDQGDTAIGLPPYNGGLFSRENTPLLDRIRLGDALMASVIDTLSFIQVEGRRRYINYRDLSVQQLGSIYERLLEHEIVREDGEVRVRPNIFARKGSGSYYTPDDLVSLVIDETIGPLVERTMSAFHERLQEQDGLPSASRRLGALTRFDPAMRLLELKICDPAMGSGHFPVSLVDKLADHIIEAMAEAGAAVDWGEEVIYTSPLAERIEAIRNTIMGNAEARGWAVNEDQLDDRHIIRRMVLKRCVYGVDKNPMAVELAKVSLWLHTFTVGAPLSFLDHHLRSGDSLFGSWVKAGIEKVERYGSPLLLHGPIRAALQSAAQMQIVEGLTDAEIAEAERSSQIYDQISDMTGPLNALLSLIHALDWLNLRGRENIALIQNFFDGDFGDPVRVLLGQEPLRAARDTARFADILEQARELIKEERFLHWQVAFPGIWSEWEAEGPVGGFDAVVGNPPWDRIKLQQVEWFAARRPDIARAQRAADRNRMVNALVNAEDPLAQDFEKANLRAEAGIRMARTCGDYPLLSGGDINIYSLFVERAMRLVKPDGMTGVVVPSGIASDKTASTFFKGVATEGRLKALFDFENKKIFFPAVHASFKFCVFVASPSPTAEAARCAFYLHSVDGVRDPDRCFAISAQDFARVNPNTGTAPIFRTRRDAALTTAIYERLPVLVDRSGGAPVSAWPVRYMTMFHMTNDSGLFHTRTELEEQEGAFHLGGNRYRSAAGDWVPLYVGRMIHIYDHRAASVRVNEANLHNAALSGEVTVEEKANPNFVPTPQFWVPAAATTLPVGTNWTIAFRDIARATDVRTMICAATPAVGYGNTAPLILSPVAGQTIGPELLANLASIPLDYVTRQKAQSTHLNWYIVEQLPVVSPATYRNVRFGQKSAGEIVREAVLELTYTAHDMAPFARDMGYVQDDGTARQPFVWDEERRLHLRAKLDALYFGLYGVTERDDVRYIYSTFPIVEREEVVEWGSYRSRDLCLAYMNALRAGHPDAVVEG